MDLKDYRAKTKSELKKLVDEKRDELRHFRFGSSGAKTKDVMHGRNVRKEIARIFTIMNEKPNK